MYSDNFLADEKNQPRTKVGLCAKLLNICIILYIDKTRVPIIGKQCLDNILEVIIDLL